MVFVKRSAQWLVACDNGPISGSCWHHHNQLPDLISWLPRSPLHFSRYSLHIWSLNPCPSPPSPSLACSSMFCSFLPPSSPAFQAQGLTHRRYYLAFSSLSWGLLFFSPSLTSVSSRMMLSLCSRVPTEPGPGLRTQ